MFTDVTIPTLYPSCSFNFSVIVSYDFVFVSSMLITLLKVFSPVERDVAVEAESGQIDVESYVVTVPDTGKFINDSFSCVG